MHLIPVVIFRFVHSPLGLVIFVGFGAPIESLALMCLSVRLAILRSYEFSLRMLAPSVPVVR